MFRRTPRLFAATLAVAALALGACAEKSSDDAPAPGGSSAAAAFPATVGKLTLDKRPEKIVSLSPTATEMLFAIGAGKQVTAVDDQSNYPPDAPKTDLSGFQPNAEAIAGKSPDLVVLSNDTNKIVDQLTTLKIPVLVTPAATTLEDSYRQLADLGTLTGHPDEAADVVTRMKDDIAKLTKDLPQRSAKLTYYHELGPELYSATSRTFIGSIYALAGLENIADAADADGKNGGYPQLSQEIIVKANPDFVFLADTKCCKQSPETVKARSGWAGVTAVKNNQVVALDDDIASRWGPRVVDLLRAVVDAVAKVPA
ncbi:ABC transporter substrate-binding protein [Micromonospora carbonacea]|uniref:ABC transporter substrate-binding protein n=1 Tax=Micromonospora carbonacea TaxID=47853 RepID=A0A1C4Z0A0_9ACTN|nr:ABC transporter substrate-binding protein [Micromonospora carbonacea]MBB5829442.1 iron complex transport system substrate-binding protein [Micromonospora carbonacea]QLD23127.1 ABC transporter substrate-binding protein [Micromonospora carbonacea]SCF26011.1 iron complex transport system substrate-binding protein [Micromonospora carbonacea]